MSKIDGTVKRSDLEGGRWVLETSDGDTYELHGQLDGLSDGKRVRVEGKVEKEMMGIGMTGPTFTVTKVTPL